MSELSALISVLNSYASPPRPSALQFVRDYPKFLEALKNISELVGVQRVKDQVASQVQGFIVNYRLTGKPTNGERLHTLLYGPPGCGKTCIGRYLAELWTACGCLSPGESTEKLFFQTPKLPQNKKEYVIQNLLPAVIPTPGNICVLGDVILPSTTGTKFTCCTRGDLVGPYQGHTGERVRKLLMENIGGVIMIDEAYSLCLSSEDQFGMEALAEINEFMTRYPDKIVFIFAGYQKEIEEGIFKVQPGLVRRFSWSFQIDHYTPSELSLIFSRQLRQRHRLHLDPPVSFFETRQSDFPHFGGDTETLSDKVAEINRKSRWIDALSDDISKDAFARAFETLTQDTLRLAFESYIQNSSETRKRSSKELPSHLRLMYGC